jgi:2,3-bisphosphoglycerate-independent phosphoglycerate mutase
LVQSPKVATYDLQPEMSAREVTDKLIGAIEADRFDLIVVNYANGDMVGHTGDLAAAISAVEALDQSLARVLIALEKRQGVMLITADHGNAEMMRDPQTGAPHTAHTTFDVPVILAGRGADHYHLANGRLADVAPTILELMGLARPAAMTGQSLLRPVPSDTIPTARG